MPCSATSPTACSSSGFEDFGLNSVLDFRAAEVQTWRGKRGLAVWQLDYLFVSRRIASKVLSAEVLSGPRIDELSDHRPIAVEIVLG